MAANPSSPRPHRPSSKLGDATSWLCRRKALWFLDRRRLAAVRVAVRADSFITVGFYGGDMDRFTAAVGDDLENPDTRIALAYGASVIPGAILAGAFDDPWSRPLTGSVADPSEWMDDAAASVAAYHSAIDGAGTVDG